MEMPRSVIVDRCPASARRETTSYVFLIDSYE